MSDHEDELRAIRKAHNAYEDARCDLLDDLSEMDRDQFDLTLSQAEEFGARHVRTALQRRAEQQMWSASVGWFDRLEQKLQRYVDANYILDGMVAEQEQRRIEEGPPSNERTLAFHGEFPVVNIKAMTITFPGRAPEPVILVDGRGPEPLQPQPTRRRVRGRSR